MPTIREMMREAARMRRAMPGPSGARHDPNRATPKSEAARRQHSANRARICSTKEF